MKNITFFLTTSVLIMAILSACQSSKIKSDSKNQPPDWAKEAIWYQIFVERFYNGNVRNDPTRNTIYAASDFKSAPDDWHITPWTQDWYTEDQWAANLDGDFYQHLQLRRLGGDLEGVLKKLDYLSDLGITAIYFNPLNDAPSLHKYDVRHYHHIDINFGPDPEGDMAIIANEIPDDPSTWQWTSADKMFLELIKKLHERGIRVILDYSWNHTGVEFWAWKDLIKNQENSAYKNWYEVLSFDKIGTIENEFNYKGWLNINSLPELKKTGLQGLHKPGHPFEGDLNEGAKQHVFAVTKRWLAPNGNVSEGIDGFRLDVADHIPMGFWKSYYQFVKNINPEAYLVGEIWWEEWPDKLMNPVPYVNDAVFDAIMFYQLYRPARYFFAKTDFEITASELKDSLSFQWERLDESTRQVMMNTASTHDSPRLLSSFYNKGKYKYNAKPSDDPEYKTGKPDSETYKRVQLYLIHQFTIPGAPHIWNGEEMGMWGADDPDCRKPLWWPEFEFQSESGFTISSTPENFYPVGFNYDIHAFYKNLIRIRKENKVLSRGAFNFLTADGKLLVYSRLLDDEEIIVAFNLDSTSKAYQLPLEKTYKNLLDESTHSDMLYLEPLSGFVLKQIAK